MFTTLEQMELYQYRLGLANVYLTIWQRQMLDLAILKQEVNQSVDDAFYGRFCQQRNGQDDTGHQ